MYIYIHTHVCVCHISKECMCVFEQNRDALFSRIGNLSLETHMYTYTHICTPMCIYTHACVR